jgi:hypothetical protein
VGRNDEKRRQQSFSAVPLARSHGLWVQNERMLLPSQKHDTRSDKIDPQPPKKNKLVRWFPPAHES